MNVEPNILFAVHEGAPFVGHDVNDHNLLLKGRPLIMRLQQLLPVSPQYILYLLCDRLDLARFFTCRFLQATNSVPMKSLRPLERAGWDRCIVPEMPV